MTRQLLPRRLRDWRMLRRVRRAVADSGLFDALWYAKQYPDTAKSSHSPLDHYLLFGAAEGRDPHPLFDSDWYLRQYPDVDRTNPLFHYVRYGAAEGRDPSPLFDSDWYLAKYPDVGRTGANPLFHYVRYGAAEGRDPSPLFDSDWYLTRYPDVAKLGLNPLAHFARHGVNEGREPRPASTLGSDVAGFVLRGGVDSAAPGSALRSPPLAAQIVQDACRSWAPLRSYAVPGIKPRITLITDSLGPSSLFGGVATSMIFAAMIAQRIGASLRVATRHEKAEPRAFGDVLKPSGVEWNGNVEFAHINPGDPASQLDVGEHDLFITTSWWTTASVKAAIPETKIIYLLQEDERMFYPHGDERLRCSEVLESPGLRFVINSELLHRHLVASGLDNIRERGLWFEPSFPLALRYETTRPAGKKRFLFYARPNNQRNLYLRGLEAIDAAIARKILDPEAWEIFFVGKDLAPITLARGVVPELRQSLRWSEYAALMRTMDVGLSLMYTPHPSYPPLDLAACGAVAVTNRNGLKQSLDAYSKNILCRGTDVESLVAGIGEAVALANDWPKRSENYRTQSLLRDWNRSFGPVLDKLTSE